MRFATFMGNHFFYLTVHLFSALYKPTVFLSNFGTADDLSEFVNISLKL